MPTVFSDLHSPCLTSVPECGVLGKIKLIWQSFYPNVKEFDGCSLESKLNIALWNVANMPHNTYIYI